MDSPLFAFFFFFLAYLVVILHAVGFWIKPKIMVAYYKKSMRLTNAKSPWNLWWRKYIKSELFLWLGRIWSVVAIAVLSWFLFYAIVPAITKYFAL